MKGLGEKLVAVAKPVVFGRKKHRIYIEAHLQSEHDDKNCTGEDGSAHQVFRRGSCRDL